MNSVLSLLWDLHWKASKIRFNQYPKCKDVQAEILSDLEQLQKALANSKELSGNEWLLEFLAASLDTMVMKQCVELRHVWRKQPLQFYFFKQLRGVDDLLKSMHADLSNVADNSQELEVFWCVLSLRALAYEDLDRNEAEKKIFAVVQSKFKPVQPSIKSTSSQSIVWQRLMGIVSFLLLMASVYLMVKCITLHLSFKAWSRAW